CVPVAWAGWWPQLRNACYLVSMGGVVEPSASPGASSRRAIPRVWAGAPSMARPLNYTTADQLIAAPNSSALCRQRTVGGCDVPCYSIAGCNCLCGGTTSLLSATKPSRLYTAASILRMGILATITFVMAPSG